ncbi:MAG: bifunctional phosphopantothenoylcysteine decarboxylase/phosphopantothenate--cysteine ligase CoaBC [Candidatus Eremiobacteraeota bacterium]|nr:bifunctional phosphopantothenoylcysteine decarboxylase/phosphopantothenate--cysteine ligase CoaBC [Candidatus Eremiobacteraeota bacterium]MBV8354893.1 bifunctional phosphopantothenoylcysteine decarboxylase/phosphopantothenate--cysteine ligase CoaBC [Candidatus Eremiobacteraeota bacterium]
MTSLEGRRVLLGVCGGIAAYKAAALTSTLVQRGAELDVIMTDDAQRFVGSLTFAALTRRPVYTSLWENPESIPHITLVRRAEVLAIVPATANVLAKIASGIADDLLTNAALAAKIPLVVAPAMNSAMYEHPATAQNLAVLRGRGVTIVEPDSGFLAEREHGIGRLADEEKILAAVAQVLARHNDLAGERIVITAGPTREPIDPVRFISNASTGTTGVELAREALARGADVDLVMGPANAEPPSSARVHRVTTARQMYDATLPLARRATVLVATAAVADWRPAQTHEQKVKKSFSDGDGELRIDLVRNPDILAEIGKARNGTPYLIGFAAETEEHEAHGREKLRRKHLDAIAVNDVASGRGFGAGENELILLFGDDGRIALGSGTKRELAIRFWDAIAKIRVRGAP